MTFQDLHIEDAICRVLETIGYKEPLEVQQQVIPMMLSQRDCIVKSKTGSGKTASFALPIVQSLIIDEKCPQALILSPTRELSSQIKDEFDTIGTFKKVKTVLVTGKQPFRFQKEDLSQRTHVVIGTPGRVLDHLQQGTIQTNKIKYVVLDEADEMLNMNFLDQIQSIFQYLTQNHTTCIFSATYPEGIQRLTSQFLQEPTIINIGNQNAQVEQIFYESINKDENMLKLLCKYLPESCMIFCNTQQRVEELYQSLKSFNISCTRIHGGMMQEERFSCMKQFKQGKVRILIATDVAARGIDVQKVDLVINYDFPSPIQLYVHRIGRSGRVSEKGLSISFINHNEKEKLEEYFQNEIQIQDFEEIDISHNALEQLSKSIRIVEDKTIALRQNVMKLYINGGKNKKIRPGDIVGAICEIDGVQVEDIGIIQVQDRQSYVDIMNGKGEIVLNALKIIKKKPCKVEIAK